MKPIMFNIIMASSSRLICFRLVLVAALLFGSACPSHGFLPQTASMRHTTTSTSNTQQRSTKVVPPIHYINGDETSSESLIAVEKDDVVPATTATSSTTSSSSSSSRSCRSYQKPIHTQTNVCSRTGVTLSRYMMEMEKLNPELNEVESIFTSIQVACKAIGKLVKTASLEGHTGVANGGGSMNSHGEEQKTMDVLANDILMKAFQWSGHMRTLCSEEEDAPIDAMIDQEGDYIACFDPLDGSSNVDCGVPVGTIFGIFKADSNNHSRDCRIKATKETNADDNDNDDDDDEGVCLDDALQPGNNLVAAGYCLYSSATTLVFTLGDGVHGFTLDEGLGEFVLTHPNMQIPSRGKIYSFNEGNRWDWDEPLQNYITAIQKGQGESATKYSGRYIGSMVADIHRTLHYGGIFGYPADKKNTEGKLRLLYEAAPMAYLIEQAGGMATTGAESIMDLQPDHVHQRVPCILGSKDDVNELLSYYKKEESTTTAAQRSPLWGVQRTMEQIMSSSHSLPNVPK